MSEPNTNNALTQAASSIAPTDADRQLVRQHVDNITTMLKSAGWPLVEALVGGATARATDITQPIWVELYLIASVDASAMKPKPLLDGLSNALAGRLSTASLVTTLDRFIEVAIGTEQTIALVPAVYGKADIQHEGESVQVDCMLVPSRSGGEWVPAALPKHQREIVDHADQQAGGMLRHLIRLVKCWNRDRGAPLHPMLLEVLCYGAFPTVPNGMIAGLATLFRHLASSVLEACPDPTGIGPRLDDGLPPERRRHLSALLRSASDIVEQARIATEQGYANEAHNLLLSVIGTSYPKRAIEPLPVLLCLDVFGALPLDEIQQAAGVDFSPPEILREAPTRPLLPTTLRPDDWQDLGRMVATLAARARELRRPDGPPLRIFIAGLAPLPLFVQLGLELSSWLGEQVFVNRRPTGIWDRLPLHGPLTENTPVVFDAVRGLRQGDPSLVRGRVAVFIALSSYTTPVTTIETFYRAQGEDLAGIVEIRSERNVTFDAFIAPAAAAELTVLWRQIRGAYPAATGIALFVAGPASLAYLVGRTMNPNVVGNVLVANFQAPDYVPALRLPFLGGTKSTRWKVQELDIEGFRGLAKMRIEFNESLTVLIGVNGTGKTSVLDALALLLSQFTASMRDGGVPARISPDDISIGQSFAKCAIGTTIDDEQLHWSQERKATSRGDASFTFEIPARKALDALRREILVNAGASIPLAVYYAVNRGDIEIPERLRKRVDGERDQRTGTHESSLLKGAADFRAFLEWFKEHEDVENSERRDKPSFEDQQLSAVRRAIERLLPGFRDPRVRRSPLRLVVNKDGQDLAINQLSDGERGLFALAGDLARRLADAHPSLGDPLQGSGVVLIDEVDLHLHPGWQQRVIDDLRRTFPGCQFIVTTHSPHVLSTVPADAIRLLSSHDGMVHVSTPDWQTRGVESAAVLAAVMGVDPVPNIDEVHWLSDYRALIQDGFAKSEEALALRKKLDAHFGVKHPLMVDCDRLIRFSSFRRTREGKADTQE